MDFVSAGRILGDEIDTGKLKEQVEKAESKEQAKELIAEAGMELTDEKLDQVAGGSSAINYPPGLFRQA
jgi:hypothetical protein